MEKNAISIAEKVIYKANAANKTISIAESCTGGMVCAAITGVSGSSNSFHYGFITYANEAKVRLLGVPEEIIEKRGAVSEEVASEMAIGARINGFADIGLGITGIAGPTGGSALKPVGLVYIAVSAADIVTAKKFLFSGNRAEIRSQAVIEALLMLLAKL